MNAQPKYLFGGTAPWHLSRWTSSDDRVRGGSSTSQLTLLDSSAPSSSAVLFSGHLDTTTLGGAGFASQRTRDALALDLAAYAGIRLHLSCSDGKKYTLVLKDDLPDPRRDGRESSGVSWEATVQVPAGRWGAYESRQGDQGVVCLRWEDFKASYRGRDVLDPEPLKKDSIKRIGIMMRSFFDEQHGDFELGIRSIAAFGIEDEAANATYRDEEEERRSMEGEHENEKRGSLPSPRERGWWAWLCGGSGKL